MLALKGNHRAMYADVGRLLEHTRHEEAVDKCTTVDSDHDRIETRTSFVSTDIEALQKRHRWPRLAAVGKVIRTRDTASKATAETTYHLLTAQLLSEWLGWITRSHWGVENRLHWFLNAVDERGSDQKLQQISARTTRNSAPHGLEPDAKMIVPRCRCAANLISLGWKGEFLARPWPRFDLGHINVKNSINFDTFGYQTSTKRLTASRDRRIWRSGGCLIRSRIESQIACLVMATALPRPEGFDCLSIPRKLFSQARQRDRTSSSSEPQSESSLRRIPTCCSIGGQSAEFADARSRIRSF